MIALRSTYSYWWQDLQQWRQGELQQDNNYEEGLEQVESINASSGPTHEQVEPQDDAAARGTQYGKDIKCIK